MIITDTSGYLCEANFQMPELKLFTQKMKSIQTEGLTPISGKVGYLILSIVLEYCILIAFYF